MCGNKNERAQKKEGAKTKERLSMAGQGEEEGEGEGTVLWPADNLQTVGDSK